MLSSPTHSHMIHDLPVSQGWPGQKSLPLSCFPATVGTGALHILIGVFLARPEQEATCGCSLCHTAALGPWQMVSHVYAASRNPLSLSVVSAQSIHLDNKKISG